MPKDKYSVGDRVKRDLDGLVFLAVVEAIRGNLVTLRYLDDGNVEKDVHDREIQPFAENDDVDAFLTPRQPQSKRGLSKPLVGLIDDDSETRRNIVPTVKVHDEDAPDEIILLNGAENKLAAGGGLRALRYLK